MLRKRPIVPKINIEKYFSPFLKETTLEDLNKETREVVETAIGKEGAKPLKTLADLNNEELIEYEKELNKEYDIIQSYKKDRTYNYQLAMNVWNGFNIALQKELEKRGLKNNGN